MKCINTLNNLSEITGNYLGWEKAFSLRINRRTTQETTKRDFESRNEVKLTL
jgi:hypothetical protein